MKSNKNLSNSRKLIRKYIVPFLFTAKIPSVTRISLNLRLIPIFKKLKPGIVLDVGSKKSPYKKYIPNTKYMNLDINKDDNPDICCDIHNIKWKDDYFDTVIATEVLEHIHNPQKAIKEIHRILKKDGICILTTRFMCYFHPDPKDYFRFSHQGLRYLFKDFEDVKIYHHGNAIQVIWQLLNRGKIGIILNIFNPLFARINYKNSKAPLGFIVLAKKSKNLNMKV